MSQPRNPPVVSWDDQRLVETANGLAQQMGIFKVEVRKVIWKPWVLIGRRARPIPSDWAFLQGHNLVMPVHMVGKLSVEEWRPLIGSAIIHEKKTKRSLWPIAAFNTTLPLLLLLAVFVIAIILDTPLIALLYFILIFPVSILGNRLYNPAQKRARLRADLEAGEILGRQQFVAALRKIDGMNLPDVQALKSGRKVRVAAGFPSITERIENLQGYSSSSSASID